MGKIRFIIENLEYERKFSQVDVEHLCGELFFIFATLGSSRLPIEGER